MDDYEIMKDIKATCDMLHVNWMRVTDHVYRSIPKLIRDQFPYDMQKSVCQYWATYKKTVLHLDENNEYVNDAENFFEDFMEVTGFTEEKILSDIYPVTPESYRKAFPKKQAVAEYLRILSPYMEFSHEDYMDLVNSPSTPNSMDVEKADMLRYCKDHGIDMYELVYRVASSIPTLKYNEQLTPEENAYAYWETYKEAVLQ